MKNTWNFLKINCSICEVNVPTSNLNTGIVLKLHKISVTVEKYAKSIMWVQSIFIPRIVQHSVIHSKTGVWVQARFWRAHIKKEDGFQWFCFFCSVSTTISNTAFFGGPLDFTIRSNFSTYRKWLPVRRTCMQVIRNSSVISRNFKVIILSVDSKINAKV